MAEDYDREEVEYLMRHKSRLRALANNPQVVAGFDRVFQQNGWVPEAGRNSFETFAEYAKALTSEDLNAERGPFEAKWEDRALYDAVAKRSKLGTSSEIRRAVEAVQANALHDELLERGLKRNHTKPTPKPTAEDQRRIEDESARHNLIRNQISEQWDEVERARAETAANHRAAALPKAAPVEVSRPSLHEALSNAYDAHAGETE